MTDGPRRPSDVTPLDLYKAIAELRRELDERLRAIEATAPSSFGPRINDLEKWRVLADGSEAGGLPAWRQDVEDALSKVVGFGQLIRWAGALITIALGILALVSWFRGPL